MENNHELGGLLAFPLTAFDTDLEINLGAFAEHVESHVAAGAGALFVACGTGEFSALSPEEHRAVLRRAREVVAGRVPVWVGAGGGPASARAGVRMAQVEGADGVLLLPPYLVTGPPAGLVNHVRFTVRDTTIPVIVYHRTPGVLTQKSAMELLEISSVVGIKDGFGDVDLMTRIVTEVRKYRKDFLFFNGLPTAEISARAYTAIGVERYSSAVHCFAPEIASTFYRALRNGDSTAVDRLLTDFYLPLVALRDETPGFAVSLVKAGARLRGHDVGGVRPPLTEPSPEQTDRLGEILKAGLKAVSALGGE